MTIDSYYCSQKFTWLNVDLEKRLTHSCCTADPARIDLTWLRKNPGQLFNTPLLQEERKAMLANQPVASCEYCWRMERQDLPSRRTIENSTERTHTNIDSVPETLNISFGSTCNLTCSYCCKQYSSAWLKDIDENGPYLDQDRFRITVVDRVLQNLSQKEVNSSLDFQLLLNEVSGFESAKQLRIAGGEPFLYNALPDLLSKLIHIPDISINTGLGVNPDRFRRQLDKIPHTVEINISAENVGKFYEFNRYGNTYDNFLENFNSIKERGFPIAFNSVVSNLTIFGLAEFVEEYSEYPIHYSLCSDPDFLAPNVIDSYSLENLLSVIKTQTVCNALTMPSTREQQENVSRYLKEFAQRRSLDLAIFPGSMLQWLSI